jgi:hypothetical protein
MTALMRRTLQIALSWCVLLLVTQPVGSRADSHATPSLPEQIRHVIQPGDTLVRIAALYRDRTGHYALNDLVADLRRLNGLDSDLLRPGRELLVPLCPPEEPSVVREPVVGGRGLCGIYLTAPMCGSTAVFDGVDRFVAVGGNGVVFDAKDIDGGVSFLSGHPLASWGRGRRHPVISEPKELVRRLHARRLWVVARIACFLDGDLGRSHPELALTDSSGAPWTERDQVWVDPTSSTVRSYNLTLACELAAAGVDEIQFDYVRFPTNGWRGDGGGDLQEVAARRRAVITGFLWEARHALAAYSVTVSADLYGVMGWERVADGAVTGQDIAAIAGCVDVLCPMVYPSHYGHGFSGVERPGDHPEQFVAEGCRRFVALSDGRAGVRPWLQAFPFGASSYDARYVRDQLRGAREAGSEGWCLWNPASRYDVALSALTPAIPTGPLAAARWRLAAVVALRLVTSPPLLQLDRIP